MTKKHKENISKACKGRKTWSKGKKMPKESLYKNMGKSYYGKEMKLFGEDEKNHA